MDMKFFTRISLTSLFSLLIFFTSHMNSCSAARGRSSSRSSIEFIKSSCRCTSYPLVCFESLSSYATTVQTSSKKLASAALSVSLAEAKSTSEAMSRLSAVRGLKAREAAALRDCVETIGNSVYQIQRSIKELGHLSSPGAKVRFGMSNIQTWVSAALTNEDTCMDGFSGKGMEGTVRSEVRRRVVNLAQLTSNALALINTFVSTQGTPSP